jgi:hypothetical protein
MVRLVAGELEVGGCCEKVIKVFKVGEDIPGNVVCIGDHDRLSGVYVRPLGIRAFEKHMKGLESY